MSNAKQKHTPGPWHVDANFPSDVMAESCAIVIQDEAINIDSLEVQANARLIAAAPEMLEACKAGIMHLGVHAKTPAEIKLRDLFIDVVAKATGGAE